MTGVRSLRSASTLQSFALHEMFELVNTGTMLDECSFCGRILARRVRKGRRKEAVPAFCRDRRCRELWNEKGLASAGGAVRTGDASPDWKAIAANIRRSADVHSNFDHVLARGEVTIEDCDGMLTHLSDMHNRTTGKISRAIECGWGSEDPKSGPSKPLGELQEEMRAQRVHDGPLRKGKNDITS